MGAVLTTVQLDTHALHWLTSAADRLSGAASDAIRGADELVVSGMTWFELAWLARHGRILLSVPTSTWLRGLSAQVRTVGISPAIAQAAADLPASFPGDPADRIIYATAVDNGWPLITKDRRLRAHRSPRPVTVW